MMRSPQSTQKQNRETLLLALLILGIAGTAGITSTRWINTVFPGFFVLANNVVASVSLPSGLLPPNGTSINMRLSQWMGTLSKIHKMCIPRLFVSPNRRHIHIL